MIEPSMEKLMQYLSSLRKPEPNMMPPMQQPNPMEMLAMQSQQPQVNPIALMLAQAQQGGLAALQDTAMQGGNIDTSKVITNEDVGGINIPKHLQGRKDLDFDRDAAGNLMWKSKGDTRWYRYKGKE